MPPHSKWIIRFNLECNHSISNPDWYIFKLILSHLKWLQHQFLLVVRATLNSSLQPNAFVAFEISSLTLSLCVSLILSLTRCRRIHLCVQLTKPQRKHTQCARDFRCLIRDRLSRSRYIGIGLPMLDAHPNNNLSRFDTFESGEFVCYLVLGFVGRARDMRPSVLWECLGSAQSVYYLIRWLQICCRAARVGVLINTNVDMCCPT